MTTLVEDWLPPGTAGHPRVMEALDLAIGSWSTDYFRKPYKIKTVGAYRNPLGLDQGHWLPCGQSAWMHCSPRSSDSLLARALDAELDALERNSADNKFLSQLFESLVVRLGERLDAVCGPGSGPGGREARPTGENGPAVRSTVFTVADGAGPDLFGLSISDRSLKALRRSQLPPARAQQPLQPQALRAALGGIALQAELILGHVTLSVAELRDLKAGDVVRTETVLEGCMAIRHASVAVPFAHGHLSEVGGTVLLTLSDGP